MILANQPGMNEESSRPLSRQWFEIKSIGGGLLAALFFITIWWQLNPARPHMETSDLFTHLSVARHLVKGEGFVTDIAYPLSFAFDFAQELPQPLIHRGPGFCLLLTAAVAPSPENPELIVKRVRWIQIIILGLIAAIGTASFLHRKNIHAVSVSMVLLGMSPLLNFSVDWAFVELPAGLMLLLIWLRHRDLAKSGPNWVDGLLVGLLSLLRWDLVWLPLLWWLWGRLELRVIARRNPEAIIPPIWKKSLLLALMTIVLINLPWAVRNTRLTGSPTFTLQGQAELAKDTRTWPGYSIYQQLEPQPVGKILAGNPVPILRKFVRGLKFYFRELGRLFPWAGLVIMALALVVYLRGGIDKNPCPLRPGAEHPMSIAPAESPLGPLVVIAGTLILMIIQYSFFDHSLRHLLVMYPIAGWELAGLLGMLFSWIANRWKIKNWLLFAPAILTAGFLVKATLQSLPGWDFAVQQAERQNSSLAEKVRKLEANPDQIPFVKTSAAPWYANRPAVWDPQNDETRNFIREKLTSQSPDDRP